MLNVDGRLARELTPIAIVATAAFATTAAAAAAKLFLSVFGCRRRSRLNNTLSGDGLLSQRRIFP